MRSQHIWPTIARARSLSSGVKALQEALKTDQEVYELGRGKRSVHVSLQADLVDEPQDSNAVYMLEALSESERCFFSDESAVVDLVGKSQVILDELHQRFAFLNGSMEEYVKYLHRQDLAPHTWTYLPLNEVKAISGLSCVMKKCGRQQRKLLMSVPANFRNEISTPLTIG